MPRLSRRPPLAGSRLRHAYLLIADYLTRHRPVWMVSFSLTDASLSEGLRAACAATSMLVLGDVLHQPDFAWAAIGAFWTCLADAAGSNRMRFASMAGFALLSTVCGGLAAYASGLGVTAAAIAVLIFAAGGALGRIWGPAVAQIAILSATACVVMVDHPVRGLADGVSLMGVYLAGCVWATALSLAVWRIHPFAPSRAAAQRVYVRLADACRDCARLVRREGVDFGDWSRHGAHHRSQIREAIELARAALAKVPPSKSGEMRASLLIALADAEQVFAFLIAVADACERRRRELPEPRRVVRILFALAELLDASGREIEAAPIAQLSRLHGRFARLTRRLEAELGEPLAASASMRPVDLELELDTDTASPEGMGRALREAWGRARAVARANLDWHSIGLRHAARTGVATTFGFLAVRALHVPFGYWATMAILLIMQPSIATSWPRSLERAAGSVAGGVVAAAIGLAIHSPIGVSVVVFPLVVATMAFRSASYSLFVFFLTPTFVLVAGFATPGAHELGYALARLGNNVLGCVIAFAATFLLWPSRGPDNFHEQLGEALAANLDYLARALRYTGGAARDLERLRRIAGLASNRAEESLQRMRLEAIRHSGGHWLALTALALCRRLAGTATRARLGVARGAEANEQGDAAGSLFAAWVDAARAQLLSTVCMQRPSSPLPPAPQCTLSLVEADATHQVQLLATVVEQYVSGGVDTPATEAIASRL